MVSQLSWSLAELYHRRPMGPCGWEGLYAFYLSQSVSVHKHISKSNLQSLSNLICHVIGGMISHTMK